MSTSVAPGIAIPHGCYRGISDLVGAIGISRTGIAYNADGGLSPPVEVHSPVYLVFLLLMGTESREKHLQVLSKIFTVLNSTALTHIKAANSSREVYDILCRFH
jgi:mannitol/fructose-specific phosphotransferase system IIA component (Ntr-type)